MENTKFRNCLALLISYFILKENTAFYVGFFLWLSHVVEKMTTGI